MQIQKDLNSDIVMIFDECTPYLSVEPKTKGQITTEHEARASMELSLRWAKRCITEFERLLDDVARDGRGPAELRGHLTSESGLVYTLLAHAVGRLG